MTAAPYVLLDASVTLNAVDLSLWGNKLTFGVAANEVNADAFGSNGWGTSLAGIKKWTVSIDFEQDFTATSGLNAILWPLLATNFPIVIKPTSAAVSTSNPKWSGTVSMLTYSPLDASIGALSTTTVNLTGQGILAMATS
jgi:hypothetical protein